MLKTITNFLLSSQIERNIVLFGTRSSHKYALSTTNKKPRQKILKVAIIGMPNAGKSTFINSFMNRPVCPASQKIHTTRSKAQAIFTEGNTQIVFMDFPGLVTSSSIRKYKLEDEFSVFNVNKSLKDVDMLGIVHDVSHEELRFRLDIKILKLLQSHIMKPSILILNKVDLIKSKKVLLEVVEKVTMGYMNGERFVDPKTCKVAGDVGWPSFREIYMVSALKDDGIDAIRKSLLENAKRGKWLYTAEEYSDQTPEDIIVKTVKAVLLDYLPQEMPYSMKPVLELFEENNRGIPTIAVKVLCPSARTVKWASGPSNGLIKKMTAQIQQNLQNAFKLPYIKLDVSLEVNKN